MNFNDILEKRFSRTFFTVSLFSLELTNVIKTTLIDRMRLIPFCESIVFDWNDHNIFFFANLERVEDQVQSILAILGRPLFLIQQIDYVRWDRVPSRHTFPLWRAT